MTITNYKNLKSYITLILVYLITSVLRYGTNFSAGLTPGVDGMYYPLQVRHFLENFNLGFPDMPFVFWLEAFFAKVINIFSGRLPDADILLSCKLTDSLLPPLAVLPVFLLSRQICGSVKISGAYSFIILCFAVLTPSYLTVLVLGFHKEAVGIVLVFTTMLFIFSYLKSKNHKFLILSISFLLLTALTHIGCLSVLLSFIFILTIILIAKNFETVKEYFKSYSKKVNVGIALFLILMVPMILVYLSDPQRFSRVSMVFKNPLFFFKDSIIYLILTGQPAISDPIRTIYFTIINLFSLFSIYVFFKIRKKLEPVEKIFFMAVFAWMLVIANPFWGSEFAERIFFHFFIPFTLVLIFTFKYLRGKVIIAAACFFYLFIALSVFSSLPRRTSFISKPEYYELTDLKHKIPAGDKTLIITKHGLEWWAGWILHTNVGLESGLKPGDWKKYSSIYLLKQKQTNQSTPISNVTQEVTVPGNSVRVIDGEHFEVFKLYGEE